VNCPDDEEIMRGEQRTRPGEFCKSGKTCYDKKTAQTKKNLLEDRGNRRALRIYHCPDCNLWHLTRNVLDGQYRK
jgi:hypothetical protein